MGSLEDAIVTGFICRLCSKQKRSVVFIFGARGAQIDLVNKINNYLPIQINADDDLPKTICEPCLEKILQHHQMIERFQQAQKRFLQMRNEEILANAQATGQNPSKAEAVSCESAHSSKPHNPNDPATKPLETTYVATISKPADTGSTEISKATKRVRTDQQNGEADSDDAEPCVSDTNSLGPTESSPLKAPLTPLGSVSKRKDQSRSPKIVRTRLK
ncbi:AGAP001400-PA-like protein [Anopheles sinensis]|uniref:AGAP001400-PA-like protein n=1 Tax=Anopheles sinensis TaxID=74873 RepID=A0A084WQT0_ANOSI|nr:AGAP001400-PA-like protein [Anopheles sinensis]